MVAHTMDKLHRCHLHGSRFTIYKRHSCKGASTHRYFVSIFGIFMERFAATGAGDAIGNGVQEESLERAFPSTQHSELESFDKLADVGKTIGRLFTAIVVDSRAMRRACANLHPLVERPT